ncbi:MAG: DUF2304 domain-containing protein [Solirubrobacterales bacterium]|nr:DUF2304 domain-containing protein [Solirubrobacterales bacterium]
MQLHLRLAAVGATVVLLVMVLELVRRRRLLERYALVWMAVTALLIGLTLWSDLLTGVASVIGIAYPPSALFLIAFGFVILLLLHFSVAVSRLTDQSKVLAQELSLLDERLRRHEASPTDELRDSAVVAGDYERSEV